jgi:hypothetical protein
MPLNFFVGTSTEDLCLRFSLLGADESQEGSLPKTFRSRLSTPTVTTS